MLLIHSFYFLLYINLGPLVLYNITIAVRNYLAAAKKLAQDDQSESEAYL